MRTLLLAVVVVGLAACSRPPGVAEAPPAGPTFPTMGWPASTPDAEGLDAAALTALSAEFASGARGQVTGMLVIRHGKVVFEQSYPHDFDALFQGRDPERGPYNYYDPDWHPYYRKGRLHTMQSVSKSVTSALVGIAIARGELPDVSAPVAPFFDGFRPADTDPRRSSMTLEHVLTMTTGIRWDESTVTYTDPANSCANMERSADWISRPRPADGGGTWHDLRLQQRRHRAASHLIWKGTGRHAHEYAAEHLFGPLGITDFHWKQTPTGLADTEGGLYLTRAIWRSSGISTSTTASGTARLRCPTAGCRRQRARRSTRARASNARGSTATSGGCCPTERPAGRPGRRSATAASDCSSCPSTT